MTHQSQERTNATWLAALATALSWSIAKRSLLIMLIVGSVLNLINQGDALISGGSVNWYKIVLTYCVPFCVATYGAFCAIRTLDNA